MAARKKKPGLEFEKIVGQTHRKFAGENVTVTENAFIPGKSGAARQIDVLLQASIPGLANPLNIIVECKDYGRPLEIGKVDGLIGRMQDTGAARGVLVSNSGFTEGAIGLARSNPGVELSSVLAWREPTIRQAALAPHMWIFVEVKQPIATCYDVRIKNAAHESTEFVSARMQAASALVTDKALKDFEYDARDEWQTKGRELPEGDTLFTRPLCDDDQFQINLFCTFTKTTTYYYKEDERLLATGFYDSLSERFVTGAAEMSPVFDPKYIRRTYKIVDSTFAPRPKLTYIVTFGVQRDDRLARETMPVLLEEIEVMLPVAVVDGVSVFEPTTIRMWDI